MGMKAMATEAMAVAVMVVAAKWAAVVSAAAGLAAAKRAVVGSAEAGLGAAKRAVVGGLAAAKWARVVTTAVHAHFHRTKSGGRIHLASIWTLFPVCSARHPAHGFHFHRCDSALCLQSCVRSPCNDLFLRRTFVDSRRSFRRKLHYLNAVAAFDLLPVRLDPRWSAAAWAKVAVAAAWV